MTAEQTRYGDVFAVRPFRSLWYAQLCSVVGDRLALVALTLLVFDRTRSPVLTAAAYAAGYVPWVAGALLLSGLSDRFARRRVMVACDLARTVLVLVMVVPGVPLVALVLLLFVVTSLAPPFESARAAITPQILHGDRYVLGTAVLQATYRAGLVAGSAAGGVVVAVLGARPALAADAATFAVSALLVRALPADPSGPARGVRIRPLADAAARLRQGARTVFRDPVLRTLMSLGWLAAFYAVPDGLAGPLAGQLRAGAAGTGLILAASPLGGVLVTPVFSRLVGPARRLVWMGPLAVSACAVLCAAAVPAGLDALLTILAVSGACGVYQVTANAVFVQKVPAGQRAQAFGLAAAGVVAGQGVMFIVAGAAAQFIGARAVIAAAGGIGTAAAVGLWIRWRRLARCPAAEEGAAGT